VRGVRLVPAGPLWISMLAVAILGWGCRAAAPISVGTTFPPVVTAKPVDGDAVIDGLKAELGPDSPVHFKATADTYVDTVLLTIIMEGDFQGNEMDGHISFRRGGLQLSFDVIAADGKAYVRPYRGKWARSPEKVPPDGSGPFGDMRKAELQFKGPSKTDKKLYTIVWSDPTHAARALNGTVFTSVRIKSAVMTFQVDSTGRPYTATYTVKGSGKVDGETYSLRVEGYYQFFRIHDPLVFEAPIK
jgi:hypothetical protein